MSTKSGVDIYAKGVAIIEVNFWDGICDCRHCPYVGTNTVLEAGYCKITGTYIDKSNLRTRAGDCPVTFKEE